jgi:hypothetical protein
MFSEIQSVKGSQEEQMPKLITEELLSEIYNRI